MFETFSEKVIFRLTENKARRDAQRIAGESATHYGRAASPATSDARGNWGVAKR
jgi:hypothetical protein